MHVLHFASQPASFNQVHQTLVQLAIMQKNPITMGEHEKQPNIWLHTPTPHTQTHTYRKSHAPTRTQSNQTLHHGYKLLEN